MSAVALLPAGSATNGIAPAVTTPSFGAKVWNAVSDFFVMIGNFFKNAAIGLKNAVVANPIAAAFIALAVVIGGIVLTIVLMDAFKDTDPAAAEKALLKKLNPEQLKSFRENGKLPEGVTAEDTVLEAAHLMAVKERRAEIQAELKTLPVDRKDNKEANDKFEKLQKEDGTLTTREQEADRKVAERKAKAKAEADAKKAADLKNAPAAAAGAAQG
jgi:hypothetical protein